MRFFLLDKKFTCKVQSYEYIFKKQVFVGYCFFEKKILSLQVKLGEVCFFEI